LPHLVHSASLQWGRGLATAEGRVLCAPLVTVLIVASMGPRPRDRGRMSYGMDDRFRQHTLQWGRGLATAEGLQERVDGVGGPDASMGPRPRDRGRPGGNGADGAS